MIHTTTCWAAVGKLLPGDIHLNRYANYVIVNIRFTDDYVKRLQITVHIDMHVVERRFFYYGGNKEMFLRASANSVETRA